MLKNFLSYLIAIVVTFSFNLTPALAQAKIDSSANSIQPYLQAVKNKVTEFTLAKNIKFVLLENHQSPTISFTTYVDVGGANEPVGKTGVAHFLEHLAFKGTDKIGTNNYFQEKIILDELDQVFQQIKQAKSRGNQAKLSELETEFKQLREKASTFVVPNEFGQIVEIEGGVGLNATTSADATIYYYSFPANKLELWMYLESERFLHPAFREFYSEKQVILEERKMRTDNSPVGKMVESFLDTAFTQHPYKRPVIGYEEDLVNLTRKDVSDFFAEYYGGSNITIAIVGDIDPEQVKTMTESYFGRFPLTTKPAKLSVKEPPQQETRDVTVEYPSQPWYFEGYHIPDFNHPDYIVYEMISSILSSGRTSRLYQSLVEEEKIALSAAGFAGFPGDKYPNLMLFYGISAPDRNLAELATALHQEIERLKIEPVDDDELKRVQTQARASLLRSVDSNAGMAKLLAEYQAKTGDWRNLFTRLDDIASVTKADIQRVAQETFVSENKTIGKIITKEVSNNSDLEPTQ